MTLTCTVYGFGPSHNAVRPEIALREKGASYERLEVNLLEGAHREPPLSEVSPRGQVPTLVLSGYAAGGAPLTVYESVATIQVIDELVPGPHLMPSREQPADRARAHMRIAEFQAKLDPCNIFGSVVFRRQGKAELQERIDKLFAELRHWDRYVEEGGDFLAGAAFGLADIAVFPLLVHFEALGFPFEQEAPALGGYLERCKSRESVQETGWLGRFAALMETRQPERVLSR